MIYGMYLSASGVLTSMSRQDVYSNNLSNLATTGFKPQIAAIRERDVVRVEDDLPFMESNALLEKLGGGVLMQKTRWDLTPGALEQTGQTFDFGINGHGYFVIDSGSGEGAERMRLSRDGRFTLDPRGRLVRVTDSLPVMNEDGEPIVLDRTAPISVMANGSIRQGENEVARIRLMDVTDPGALTMEGFGLFRAAAGTLTEATGQIEQGQLERSAVDPVRTLMEITKSGSAVEQNARMIQLHYETVGRAISTLGRVA